MSFELLDDILLESGKQVVTQPENVPDKDTDTTDVDANISNFIESISDSMYADLDQLIEDSMRTSLRSTITESSIPPETKVEQLSIVERAIFTKDQMTKFVNENVHPILDCAGVFNGTYNLGGDNPIAVSLPVYEMALILHIANEGLLESLSLEEGEKPEIKNSLYESMIKNQEQDTVDVKKSMEIVNEHLSLLYDRYGIESDENREAVFNEAISAIKESGVNNLRPSFYEIAECVCEYNKNAEKEGEKLFGEILPEDTELSENVFVKASERIKSKLNGLISQTLKNKYNNVSESTQISDTPIISLANTATGISAMVQWRDSSQCENQECIENAFKEAVSTVKAQATTCKNTVNEKLCESCNKKLEEKWEIKKIK